MLSRRKLELGSRLLERHLQLVFDLQTPGIAWSIRNEKLGPYAYEIGAVCNGIENLYNCGQQFDTDGVSQNSSIG